MKKLHVLVAILFCFTPASGYPPEKKWMPEYAAQIPPFMQFLPMINMNWFIRNVSALDDAQCNKDLLAVLEALSNSEVWAELMVDSSSDLEPGVLHYNYLFLGDYDECIYVRPTNVNFTSQYCLISLEPTQQPDYEMYGLQYKKHPGMYVAKCLPSTCSREYINKILSELKVPNSDAMISDSIIMKINEGDCRKENERPPFTTRNYFTLAFLLSIVGLIILSTSYELWQKRINNNDKLDPVFSAFSLIRNTKQALLIGVPSDKADAINAMKVIATLIILYYHTFYVVIIGNYSDQLQTWGLISYNVNAWSFFFGNSYNATDMFLFCAGLLLVIIYYRDIQKKNKYNPITNCIKRYINIMSPLFLIILLRMGISEHFDDGPAYNAFNNNYYRKRCEGSITSTVFLYHNYVQMPHEMCFQHSWYLPVDLHLYFVSQIILMVTFWNENIGISLTVLMTFIGMCIEFTIGYIYDLGPNAAMDVHVKSFTYDYTFSHTRSAPWFAGMVFGFITIKAKERKIRLTKGRQVLGWLVACVSFVAATLPIAFMDYKTFTQPYSALFLSTHRIFWAILVGWVVFAMNNGYAELVMKFCKTRFFAFIGNISYEMFIVHIVVIEFFVASARHTYYFSPERLPYHTFAVGWISAIWAVVLAVSLTIPIRNLANHYLNDVQLFAVVRKDPAKLINVEIKQVD